MLGMAMLGMAAKRCLLKRFQTAIFRKQTFRVSGSATITNVVISFPFLFGRRPESTPV
jgi:hypothetical protein